MNEDSESRTGRVEVTLETYGPSFEIIGKDLYEFPSHEFVTVLEADSLPDLYRRLWIEHDRHRDYVSTVLGAQTHFVGKLSGIKDQSQNEASFSPDVTAIRGLQASLDTQIEFERTVGIRDKAIVDTVSEGLEEAGRLLDKAPIESITYAAFSWYGRGVFSVNLFETYLDFWRSIETLAKGQWRLERGAIDDCISKRLSGLSADRIKKMSKILPDDEELLPLERSAWILNRFGVDFKEKELKKLSDMRNKIAHGSAALKDLETVHDLLPRLEYMARQVLGAKASSQYGVTILSPEDMDALRSYRLLVGQSYELGRPSVRITHSG